MPTSLNELRERLKKHAERGINIGYLQTVLFPEQFTNEVPIPLSSISYCKFTDKQEYTLNTGPKGQGVMVWYPRTTFGPQLFVFHADDNTSVTTGDPRHAKGLPTTGGIPVNGPGGQFSFGGKYYRYWKVGLPTYTQKNFAQTAIVGASLTVQYIGKVEDESGLMVGGHVYGVPLEAMTLDDIENAQWVTRGRPGEGMRFLFLPKDATDYEFYPCVRGMAYNQGSTPGGQQASDQFNIYANVASATVEPAGNTNQTLMGGFLYLNNKEWRDNDPKKDEITTTQIIQYTANTNCVAIYWTGMATNQDWIRVDSIRKFCGLPTQQSRDIVELQRPSKNYDVNKTFAVLNLLGSSAPVGGHTLREIDRVMDAFIQAIPNLGYMLDNGGLEPTQTLDEMVRQISGVGDPRQVEGPMAGQMKKLYKFF